MNASNLQPTVVNLFVVSLKEVLTLDHADTNQIINTVSWLREPIFFRLGQKNTSWSGWLCGCCFLWMGLFGVAFETKGKGRIEGGGARWTQKKKLFSWSEMGWVGLCHPSDTNENFRPFIGVILYNSSYDDIVAHLVGEVCDGWCESKIHSI